MDQRFIVEKLHLEARSEKELQGTLAGLERKWRTKARQALDRDADMD